ncbi:MAG: 23S rRNA (guanosine(2251)-2'-O)-methyltransferase RlmB [Rhodospirillales bacterium]|nr:23S rRNA (guanosine(2251)-2'-O)-methyltransferase RlmB [Rhodospirillales bacterium]
MSKRKPPHFRRKPEQTPSPHKAASGLWIYGIHACRALLANPQRRIHQILVTRHTADLFDPADLPESVPVQIVERTFLDAALPPESVHQGIAINCEPLPDLDIADIIALERADSVVVVLDQANDPRNIGSVMRSAAAFGADAVIVPDRGTPEVSGSMAKAAAGALESIPFVRVTNLARSLRKLKDAGYWCVGLDGTATQTLAQTDMTGKTAIVMGAEGTGLRQLTAETCDFLAKIPISGEVESLNLSIATSIALYERNRTKTG